MFYLITDDNDHAYANIQLRYNGSATVNVYEGRDDRGWTEIDVFSAGFDPSTTPLEDRLAWFEQAADRYIAAREADEDES